VIAGAAAFLFCNLVVLLAARALAVRVRSGAAPLDTLSFLLIRLALIAAVVMVAGMMGLLAPLGLAAIGALGLVALGVSGSLRFTVANWRSKVLDGWPSLLLAACTAVIVLRLLAQVWLFAPYAGDALSYHLPKIAEWVRAGGFTREMGPDTHASFPAGFELIETWWVVFLHHDVLIEMAGVEFLILAFAAAYALARHVGLAARWAYFASLAFVLTPGLNVQATSCLNDLPIAALVVSAAAFIAEGAPLGLIVLACGLGGAIKGTFVYALPGLAALFLMELLHREREARAGRRVPIVWPEAAARRALPMAALGIAMGAFFYLRNALWYGNPFYPAGWAGVVESHGYVTIRMGPSLDDFFTNLAELVVNRIPDRLAAYSALSRNVSGWGAFAFACGIPALLVGLIEDGKLRRLTGALALSALSVLLLVRHDPWYARFVLFLPVVLALAGARLAAQCRPVLLVAVPALLFEFGATMLPEELPAGQFALLWHQPWRERTTALYYGAQPPDDAVAYYADNYSDAYLLYRPDFTRRITYLRSMVPEEIAGGMRRAGARGLYAVPGTGERMQVLNQAVRRGLLRHVRGHFYVLP
jgi:hypothetical protein